MGATARRLVLLFVGQLPAFHVVFFWLLGSGIWLFVALSIWVLVTTSWFAIANRHRKKQWLYLPLALIIAIAGQLVSWISFLYLLFSG